MSEAAWTGLILAAAIVIIVAVLAVTGKRSTFDSDCVTHIGGGCITGKPLRIEDDK